MLAADPQMKKLTSIIALYYLEEFRQEVSQKLVAEFPEHFHDRVFPSGPKMNILDQCSGSISCAFPSTSYSAPVGESLP